MAVIRSSKNSPPLLKIEPFRGMDLSTSPTLLDEHRSPDMLNINLDEHGSIHKRTGFKKAHPSTLQEKYAEVKPVSGMFEYRKRDGSRVNLITHGFNIFKQVGEEQPVEIISPINNMDRVTFFNMNDKCYVMDGVSYYEFDGTNLKSVTPYIPTISISKNPAGGGTAYEDFNLLGTWFKDSFSGDGTSVEYLLSLKDLDVGREVEVSYDGGATFQKREVAGDYTVNRSLGKVTFKTPPAKGTNNIIIKASKYFSDFQSRIKNCRFSVMYGGQNDTRLFVSGNPNHPSQMWRSGLYDPTYFPENGFYKIGQDTDPIQGFSKQYDTLIIHKKYSLWNMSYELNNGSASFPIKPINDNITTLAPESIQIIENNPVWLTKDGVYMLISSNVRDERNVQHISRAIDGKLLKEPNLEKAISVDYDKKYWLAVNGNVYIFDYVLKEWYMYDGIQASCFLEHDDGFLYFGHKTTGFVYRFKTPDEPYPYNDDGQPIKAHWFSKLMSFGADERRKMVEKVFFSLKPDIRTSADLYYISDKKSRKFIKTTRKDLYDYSHFDYSVFSYGTNEFPQEASNKIKAKKIVYFQLEIRNDKLDESFGLYSLGIKYNYQNFVK
ncbi:hypothetical protein [Bacillus infantis]|uniref:Uncharacterized protein n=1 Tax=Bacillus infantis TaxID=324767 RepID=A0A5D4R9S2_9BACI|nr:hypothetical protein [Bacillus infantis]TYS46764.1 hypothetical protein FZD51_14930 [Bacillus infantis]